MKVAKADKEEFDGVYSFINIMDSLFDGRFFSHEESWRDWDDDDEDKQLLMKIESELRDEWEGYDIFNDLILFEFIKRKWNSVNYCGSFGRIVTDAEVLIDNVCDPNLDYLEYKPDIKEALEKYEKEQNENTNT